MTDWESSGGVKIKRAKKHVLEIEAAIEAFQKRDPYGRILDLNTKPGMVLVRARISERPPLDLGAIAGDAIHNLRSALDILWLQVTHPNGGGRAKRGGGGFPFFASADKCKARPIGEKKGRAQDAMKLVKRLKPYPGGNDLLWRVHALDIADKHHVLIPTVMVVRSQDTIMLLRHRTGRRKFFMLPMPESDTVLYAVEDGAEILRFPSTSGPFNQMEVKAKLTFQVALGEVEVGKGEPILATLHQSVGAVEGVVEAFLVAGLLT